MTEKTVLVTNNQTEVRCKPESGDGLPSRKLTRSGDTLTDVMTTNRFVVQQCRSQSYIFRAMLGNSGKTCSSQVYINNQTAVRCKPESGDGLPSSKLTRSGDTLIDVDPIELRAGAI